jgi:ABC-type transport system involved in multi-copper enzyme maturation permease subunit
VNNPVLRGDLRVRLASRKLLAIQMFLLAVLGLLTFLGLASELGETDPARQTGLATILLIVQAVLVTYFASACMSQEIAIRGEKSPIDLLFAQFSPATIVAGKSIVSIVTIAAWMIIAAPLVMFAVAIRQQPLPGFLMIVLLVATLAWGMSQVGMFYGVSIESDGSRILAHWGTLLAVFVATLALPDWMQWLNPVVAVLRAAGGWSPVPTMLCYAFVGIVGDALALRSLARFAAG